MKGLWMLICGLAYSLNLICNLKVNTPNALSFMDMHMSRGAKNLGNQGANSQLG